MVEIIELKETLIEEKKIDWLTMLAVKEDIRNTKTDVQLNNKWKNVLEWYLKNKLLTRDSD